MYSLPSTRTTSSIRWSPKRLQRGVRTRLASLIAPSAPPVSVDRVTYYPQQQSCQIPNLWFLFELFFGRRTEGTFVEVGAYDGVTVSNTWGLAARGWRGWMAEPVPTLAALCRQSHAQHPAITVVETAVGAEGTHEIRLYLADTLTTANPTLFSEYRHTDWAQGALTDKEIVVAATTLDRFLGDHNVPHDFDVLVVDVEGYEAEVFSTFDLSRWTPKMLIIELSDTHSSLSTTARADSALGTHIVEAGYRIVYKDEINTVFVRNDVWEDAYSPR